MHEQLLVTVIEGRDLASKDSNGLSDPFVTMKLGKVRHSTRVVHRTLNPVFSNESYSFLLDGVHNVLKIQCWDKDIVKNDFMGQLSIPLYEISTEIEYKYPNGNGSFQRWYQLKPRGKLRIDGAITGDLLLKFEIVGATKGPAIFSKTPSGPVQVATRLIMQLQQSQLEIGAFHDICSAMKDDESLQNLCIGLGALSLLRIHIMDNVSNLPALIGALSILEILSAIDAAKEKIITHEYVSMLHGVAKYHMISRTTHQLYSHWTQALVHFSKYPELKGTIIDTTNFPFFIKLLGSENARIQENTLTIILYHVHAHNHSRESSKSSLPFNAILDSIENMIACCPVQIKRLCVKILVSISSRQVEKIKLLSLVEPLIKLLSEDTMTDDILLILLHLSDQESVRVFIIQEGLRAIKGISLSGSPTQRETTREILRAINCSSYPSSTIAQL